MIYLQKKNAHVHYAFYYAMAALIYILNESLQNSRKKILISTIKENSKIASQLGNQNLTYKTFNLNFSQSATLFGNVQNVIFVFLLF